MTPACKTRFVLIIFIAASATFVLRQRMDDPNALLVVGIFLLITLVLSVGLYLLRIVRR